MNEITHMVDKDGNVVIEALWDVNSYCAVLIPRVIGGRPYIKKSWINTCGLDDSIVKKEEILDAITTQRGKYGENPLMVEDD